MSHVGLIGENSIEYIENLIDIWNNGDCAVLIDWRIPFQTAVEMLKEADVSVCYLEDGKYEIQDSFSELDFIKYQRKSNSAEILPIGIYDKFENNYSRKEAVVLYSSGTTGKSKGIILSHYAINTNADAIIDYMKLTLNDCFYIAKTLSHSSTLIGEVLVALKSRTKLIIAPTIVPPRFVCQSISKFCVSIICLNPTLLQKLSEEYATGKYSLPRLRTIYVSGSILNDKVYDYAHNTFKDIYIFNVYGLSEAGPRVTAQREDCCKSNSVGKPIKGVDVKIIDNTGNSLRRGECGTVYVNTSSRFDEYIVGNEKLKSYFSDWLNTGDMGYIDENEELHIVGRLDDLIIINSYKVYPCFVERILLQHKHVDECKVLYTEKYGLTCVYTKTTNADIKKEIMNLLNNRVAYYEIPQKFLCIKSIPKTRTGKVSTNEIKKIIDEGGKL